MKILSKKRLANFLFVICFSSISLIFVNFDFVMADETYKEDSEKIDSVQELDRWMHPLNHEEDGRIYLDKNGIPFYDYQSIQGKFIGLQRNPVIIYRVSNVFYNDFLNHGNETSKKLFLNNANWLLENTVKYSNYSLFDFKYPNPNYQFPVGWHDAMGQGRIINLMLKAHNLTNDKKYLDEAKLISNSFFVEVSDGGVTYKNTNNGWWYEHYAHKDGLHPRVLNGMMFTLLDLNSFYEYTEDPVAKYLFNQGVTALKNEISNYDFFGYTYYDILKHSTSYNYHKIHVEKSKMLYDITHEKIFLEYHDKWKSCNEACHFFLKYVSLALRALDEFKNSFGSHAFLI